MSNRITASHNPKTDRVAVELSREDFSRLADALYFASDYQSNAYGSGWDDSTPDKRYEHSEWRNLDRIQRRLNNEATKVEQRHYRRSTKKGATRG